MKIELELDETTEAVFAAESQVTGIPIERLIGDFLDAHANKQVRLHHTMFLLIEERQAKGALPRQPPITKAVRQFVFASSNGHCVYCKVKLDPLGSWCVDHYIPKSKGGSNDPSNLVAACRQCNESKGSKMPEDVVWINSGKPSA
jgi:hypothetical protein